MRSTLAFVFLLGALAACDASPTDPAAVAVSDPTAALKTVTTTTNVKTPFDFNIFIPCANGGAGEFVDLSGRLHSTFHVTVHPNGTFTLKQHDQPQGLSGRGEESGVRYNGIGVTQEIIHTGRINHTDTFINNFKFIGTHHAGSFRVHENMHITVNGNGRVTVSVDHVTATCK